MKELLPYLIIIFVCLAGMVVEGILLTKSFKKEKAEIEKNYVDLLTKIRKDLEKEMYKQEPLEIKHTIIDTKQYEQSIIIDNADIRSFQNPDELQNIIRSSFADKFAKDVIAPNLVINEVFDPESFSKKKYFTKIHIGF